MSVFWKEFKKWLFHSFGIIEQNRKVIIIGGGSLCFVCGIILNNIRNSGPHDRKLKLFTGIFGRASIKYGGNGDDYDHETIKSIRNIMNDYVMNGEDIGTQINLFVGNKEKLNYFVVDKNRYPNYNENSLNTIFSCTKNICALLIGVAFKEKWISSYNARMNKYWPEFPTKARKFKISGDDVEFIEMKEPVYVTVADVLRHEAGLSRLFDCKIDMENADPKTVRKLIENSILSFRIFDDNKMNEMFENTNRYYHVVTQGFILNELFKIVEPKHRYMNEYFDEEIVPLLSKNDIHFRLFLKGIPDFNKKYARNKVYHIQNINKWWMSYHLISYVVLGSSFHLPKIYFNKYGMNFKRTSIRDLIFYKNLFHIPNKIKYIEFEPFPDDPGQLSKIFENPDNIHMAWMTSTGI